MTIGTDDNFISTITSGHFPRRKMLGEIVVISAWVVGKDENFTFRALYLLIDEYNGSC